MNPILQQLQRQNQNNQAGIESVISGIKSGAIDPKAKSLEMLKQMSPMQRMKLKTFLPFIEKLARKSGMSDARITPFMQEIQGSL